MEQVKLHWMTISQFRLIDIKVAKNYKVVAYPLPSNKSTPIMLGVYEYPEKVKEIHS